MLAGALWQLQVTANSWHGPGAYSGTGDSSVTLFNVAANTVTWDNLGAGTSATFDTDHSATIDTLLTSRQAAGSDHVTGSFSCAPI